MAVDEVIHKLRVPAEWPRVQKIFEDVFLMKTSELLLFAGGAGAWALQYLSIDAAFKTNFIWLLRLLRILLYKVSTPGDRAKLRLELPQAIVSLELDLPVYINTMVMHACL